MDKEKVINIINNGIDNLTDKEASDALDEIDAIYKEIRDKVRERSLGDIKKYENKFVKIYESYCVPTYMFVKEAYKGNDNYYIFSGIGFYYDVESPYRDSNYQEFETWKDIKITFNDFYYANERRKKDPKYNIYNIVEITKEEYMTAFEDMLDKTRKTLKMFIK